MKKLYLFFALCIVLLNPTHAQVVQLSESFTAPWNPVALGWLNQNNSSPIGSQTYAQGIGTVFPAFSGSPNDYEQVNFNSQGNTFGNISNFLITPTVTLNYGGVLKFMTRTATNPTSFADRLEVRMSVGTGTGNIAASVSAVGTFTTLLTTINPNLTSTGYPAVWTAYSLTITSISNTVAGRFAFRYNPTDGGVNGSNSDYIGIDDVEYTTGGPCPQAPVSVTPSNTTICNGQNVVLVASGATTYTWVNNNTHNSTLNASPISTTVYTLSGSTATNCAGYTTATVTVVNPPTVFTAPNVTACPGGTLLLTASGANTYTWSNGATGSAVVVAVTSNTFYSVTGSNAPGCDDFASVSVNINSFLNTSNPSPVACPNQTLILGASGALTYTWSTGATSSSIVITPTANGTYYVTGNDGNCNETKYITLTIDPNLFAPSFTVCAGISATLFASGANSFNWSTGSTAALIVVSPSVNTVYTVTGTSGSCSVMKTVTVTIGNNLSVNCSQACLGSSVLLSAYGANSYTWLPINDHNASVIFTPTAATVFTLVGVSGTCSGTRTIAVTYCAGVGDPLSLDDDQILIYPNPFADEINISGGSGYLRITNIFGQVVHEENLENTVQVNTSTFSAGIYFVMITRPGTLNRKVMKVIKN